MNPTIQAQSDNNERPGATRSDPEHTPGFTGYVHYMFEDDFPDLDVTPDDDKFPEGEFE